MLRRLLGLSVLPLNAAFELLVLALVLRALRRRRLARAVAIVAVAGLWLASTPIVADALLRGLEREHPALEIAAIPSADAIVLLGGSVGENRPPRVEIDLTDASDRVWLAARLWKAHKAPIVIATGGGDADSGAQPESRDVKALLVAWGVDEVAVLEDPGAGDTRGNAVGSKAILDARGLHRVLLVTSAFHMPRALAMFRALGVEAIPCPTDFLGVDGRPTTLADFVPDTGALAHTTLVVHERFGTFWYRLRGWL